MCNVHNVICNVRIEVLAGDTLSASVADHRLVLWLCDFAFMIFGFCFPASAIGLTVLSRGNATVDRRHIISSIHYGEYSRPRNTGRCCTIISQISLLAMIRHRRTTKRGKENKVMLNSLLRRLKQI